VSSLAVNKKTIAVVNAATTNRSRHNVVPTDRVLLVLIFFLSSLFCVFLLSVRLIVVVVPIAL
jgi:hypothetical protein